MVAIKSAAINVNGDVSQQLKVAENLNFEHE
jgi:hypothetical protein